MTRYLPVFLMVLAALGAGVVIVPSAWEMAFMKLRDKDFVAAEKTFEDKFLAGNRDREVLLPLAELYVRNGRVDKAISVLTQFAAAHPSDRDVTARLAALLQEAQQPARAIAKLEELAAKQPSPQALRDLDRQYDIAEDTSGRIRTLSRLAKQGSATANESLTLTNLLAATGEKTGALTAAYNAIKRDGAKTPYELVQVFSALALDTGRRDLIDAAVMPWAKSQTATASLNAVASALTDKGGAAEASRMVRVSAAFAHKDPAAYVLTAQLDTDRGEKRQAFELLDALRASGRLPAAQDSPYVALALSLTKTDTALEHISARGAEAFDDALLLFAIGHAAQSGKLAWLESFDGELSKSVTRALPQARVALALGDPARAEKLATEAETTGVSVTLAQLFADLGDIDSAERVFDASVETADGVGPAELPQAVAVAIALKRGPIALALADRLVLQDKSDTAAVQHARALTLNGRAAESLDILAKLKSKSELASIAEIEALVGAKRFAILRTKLIAKLTETALPPGQRTNLIFILNDLNVAMGPGAETLTPRLVAELKDEGVSGPAREARLALLAKIAPAQALPFLKDAAQADPDRTGYVYIKLLKDLNRTAELKTYLLHGAQHARDAKVRDDYLYELLKQGGGREALPLLAARAKNDGAKWFFAYDQELAKSGDRAGRLAALQDFANIPGTAPDLRRQIAFQLLNLGDKPRAEALFRALAAEAGPASPDVRQLAFLWGPRPPAEALAWLKARAENAPSKDRAAWAAILVNAGDARAAETALANETDAASVAALAAVYADTKNATKLRTLIKSHLPQADAKTALALANAASALSLNADAAQGFERAGAFAEAGRAALFAGDPAQAVTLLSRGKDDAETAFYLAEALTALNRPRDAGPHYRKAVSGLGKGAEATKMRVIAFARLKEHAAAERELSALTGDEDDLAEARNAYAGALLDQGDTRRAAAQLASKR